MTREKISPSLWFHTIDGKINHVVEYYANIFDNNFETQFIAPLGITPSGYTEICGAKFFGTPYFLMSAEKEHQKFNDSFSIIIYCEDQIEIDKFWDYFTREGKESQCGWCIDKFGMRWQILPKNMSELMSKPNAGQVMSKQTKIIINQY